MAKAKRIHNLDSLEKEIYRLKLEAKYSSEKLSGRLEYLQQHYASMTANSFFGRRDEKKSSGPTSEKESFFHSLFENKNVQDGINSFLDRFAAKATEALDKLFCKGEAKKSHPEP